MHARSMTNAFSSRDPWRALKSMYESHGLVLAVSRKRSCSYTESSLVWYALADGDEGVITDARHTTSPRSGRRDGAVFVAAILVNESRLELCIEISRVCDAHRFVAARHCDYGKLRIVFGRFAGRFEGRAIGLQQKEELSTGIPPSVRISAFRDSTRATNFKLGGWSSRPRSRSIFHPDPALVT